MLWKLLLSYRKQLLIFAAVVASGSIGYWSAIGSIEPKIVTNTEIVEKIVIKEIIVEKEVIIRVKVKDIKKTTTVKEASDGSKVTIVTEESKEQTDTNTDRNSSSDTSSATDRKIKEEQSLVLSKPSKWRAGVFVATDPIKAISSGSAKLDYGTNASFRLFGPVWLDSSYQLNAKTLTLGTSWEF